ncbi:cell division protein ZapA [Fundidesulfovibrio soli]|uniref:cell division protein ZapA n=1 Tax=Fundidesulfovibrio soli TaxID=2922716 RepID=UPI001FAE8390|nr:cell division protein ZapA [Fundidesulfovibrio soli]
MPSYSKVVIGLELSFKTDAEPERVEQAKMLVEDRYRLLNPANKNLSKEKLLTFVALGLADDLIMANQKLAEMEEKLDKILNRIKVPDLKQPAS